MLAALGRARGPGQTLVGFAAEHGEGAVERGRGKLERKGLDAVVVNDISRADIGFDSDRERGHDRDRRRASGAVPRGPKERGRRGDPRRGRGALAERAASGGADVPLKRER